MDVASNAAFTTSGALVDIVDSQCDILLSYQVKSVRLTIDCAKPLWIHETAEKVIVVLRDGKKMIGVLRSYDQYANLVLMDTVERLQSGNLFCDVPRGLFLIRGENVVLLGEVDLDLEDRPIPFMKEASPEEVLLAQREEEDAKKAFLQKKDKLLHQARGFSSEGQEYDAYA